MRLASLPISSAYSLLNTSACAPGGGGGLCRYTFKIGAENHIQALHQYYWNGIILNFFTPLLLLLLLLLLDQFAISPALAAVEPIPSIAGVVSEFEFRTGLWTSSLELGSWALLAKISDGPWKSACFVKPSRVEVSIPVS